MCDNLFCVTEMLHSWIYSGKSRNPFWVTPLCEHSLWDASPYPKFADGLAKPNFYRQIKTLRPIFRVFDLSNILWCLKNSKSNFVMLSESVAIHRCVCCSLHPSWFTSVIRASQWQIWLLKWFKNYPESSVDPNWASSTPVSFPRPDLSENPFHSFLSNWICVWQIVW